MITCPGCGGQQMTPHPAGPLAFDHTAACPHRDAEDATQHADLTRGWHDFTRPATPTERVLINAVEPIDPRAELIVTVRRVTQSIRHRSWTTQTVSVNA